MVVYIKVKRWLADGIEIDRDSLINNLFNESKGSHFCVFSLWGEWSGGWIVDWAREIHVVTTAYKIANEEQNNNTQRYKNSQVNSSRVSSAIDSAPNIAKYTGKLTHANKLIILLLKCKVNVSKLCICTCSTWLLKGYHEHWDCCCCWCACDTLYWYCFVVDCLQCVGESAY